MKNIFLLSIICLKFSYQAEWNPYVQDDEPSQQQLQPHNILPEPLLYPAESAESSAYHYPTLSPLEPPQYISQQFDQEFTDPQKCFSYCPENMPSDVNAFRNTVQRAFDEEVVTDTFFEELDSLHQLNPENSDFTRLRPCLHLHHKC